ncbi:cysteine--tRNA ligase, partial [Acidihalobacter prosperus]
HVGHGRMLVVFDMVVRYLRSQGYEVTYVRNITDIDDKIIRRANEDGVSIETLTQYFIHAMHEDLRALGTLPPDIEPRATQSIGEIKKMIAALIDNQYAYCADNGDIYFDVSHFVNYGQLSGKKLSDLRAGSRVDIVEAKADPLDFVLWKAAKAGEPSWSSSWGEGRPGWHIECSAMSIKALGDQFDIHGGGLDLQFPHHENEIAQSEACTGKHFVNYWMHNGFVRINDEKMSKSLGNFFTLRDIFKTYHPETVRYFFLASHYRSPLNFSNDHLDAAQAALTRLYNTLRGIKPGDDSFNEGKPDTEYEHRFIAAMDDDFNTPVALAVLFDLAHEINKTREADRTRAMWLAGVLKRLAGMLGLLKLEPERFLQGMVNTNHLSDEVVNGLIEEREFARKARDFNRADQIRDELMAEGIFLEDSPNGTLWRRGTPVKS